MRQMASALVSRLLLRLRMVRRVNLGNTKQRSTSLDLLSSA
jgi:hypothetical protein